MGSKRQHESHQNLCKNAQTIYKSQPTKKFLLSQHYEKNENDSKRPPEFICKSQILFNNDGSKYIKVRYTLYKMLFFNKLFPREGGGAN